jgi:hypothetical protein
MTMPDRPALKVTSGRPAEHNEGEKRHPRSRGRHSELMPRQRDERKGSLLVVAFCAAFCAAVEVLFGWIAARDEASTTWQNHDPQVALRLAGGFVLVMAVAAAACFCRRAMTRLLPWWVAPTLAAVSIPAAFMVLATTRHPGVMSLADASRTGLEVAVVGIAVVVCTLMSAPPETAD